MIWIAEICSRTGIQAVKKNFLKDLLGVIAVRRLEAPVQSERMLVILQWGHVQTWRN